MIFMEIGKYYVPETLEEAYNLFVESKDNKIIGGGAWVKISLKRVEKLISLDQLKLDYIQENNAYYEIGAMTNLRSVETNENIKLIYSGILNQAISNIMGVQIRNLATIGGSIMGKFAFSDLIGVLLVMDAKLEFYKLGEISIYEFLDLKKIPEDILLNIKIPKRDSKGYFKKVSKTHLDFSIINIAISKGKNFIIAVGSRPGIAQSAINTANYLNSQTNFTEEILDKACDIAIDELTFGSNLRASKEYRELLVRTYIKRGIRQVIK
jgi:CO/xanthine dehydrogenase FAD-binding subunit